MDRREFLFGAGTLLATPDLAPVLPNDLHSGHEGHLVLPINRNWRFSPTVPLNGHSPTFNDSHLQQITLPHTNIRLPWHSFDEKHYEFVSLYRRRFRLPPGLDHKRVFLDFAGVIHQRLHSFSMTSPTDLGCLALTGNHG
jgi:beta-galactosidase